MIVNCVNQVEVTLGASTEFDVLQNHEKVNRDVLKRLRVAGNDARRCTFWIIPKKIGSIDILVRAQSAQAGDALRRTLIVEVRND